MSLETVLARIAQIESSFQTNTAAPGPSAASSSAATTAQSNFATLLQNSAVPGVSDSALSVAQTGPVAQTTGATGNGSAIVNIAQSQVGQHEVPMGSNDGPAIAMYRTATQGAMAGEPWCAYFVSWAAKQAGEPIGSQGQGLGYVGDIWSWAQQTGRAIPNGPGVVPQPGDLIVFGDAHVGIVKQVLPNGSIETVEGNYNNQVENVIRGPGEATGYVQM